MVLNSVENDAKYHENTILGYICTNVFYNEKKFKKINKREETLNHGKNKQT